MRIFTAAPRIACQIFTTTTDTTTTTTTTTTSFPCSNHPSNLFFKSRYSNSNSRRFPSLFSIRCKASSSSSSSFPAAGVTTQAFDQPLTADDQNTPPPPSPAPAPAPAVDPARALRISADYEKARTYQRRGVICQARIEGFNGGGLLVRFESIVGFLPFSQLSPIHSCKEPQKNIQEIAKTLCGSLMPVKVLKVDEENRSLIFSEKEAIWLKYSQQLNEGDIFETRVGAVEDYGAFLHLRFPDGCYYLTGLVHVSEVSWDLVRDARDVLNEGENVRAKIIRINREKARITLSLKQLEEDPLLETLDKVIPQDRSLHSDSSSTDDIAYIEPLLGLETIIEELLQEDGIIDITISRQGFEKRVVSPDLQLWLSNAPPVGDQFTLLARAGRQVQEIQMTTTLDQDGIKVAVQRVLERVP